jgi:hypothetical protein
MKTWISKCGKYKFNIKKCLYPPDPVKFYNGDLIFRSIHKYPYECEKSYYTFKISNQLDRFNLKIAKIDEEFNSCVFITTDIPVVIAQKMTEEFLYYANCIIDENVYDLTIYKKYYLCEKIDNNLVNEKPIWKIVKQKTVFDKINIKPTIKQLLSDI